MSFYPYPNHNSFLLGDWYWNQGGQKTQRSFKELINIVGAPEFEPSDVQNTTWDSINKKLGESRLVEEENEWLDIDAG